MNWTPLKRMPFFTKLFASFSLVLCVPMLLLSTLVYSTSVNNLKDEILQSQQAMCRQLSQEVSSFFTSVLRSSEKVIFDQSLRSASTEEAQKRLADYVHMSDAFDQIFYVGPDNNNLSSLEPGNASLPQLYALSDQELAYYKVYISSSRSKFAYLESAGCAVYIRPVTGENATFIFVLNPQRLTALVTAPVSGCPMGQSAQAELTIDNAYEDIAQIRVFVMAADGHLTPLSQTAVLSAKG